MKVWMSFFLLALLIGLESLAKESQISDLYFAYADNDERAMQNDNNGLPLLSFEGVTPVDARGDFFTFEEVMATFSTYLESQFDTVIIANTANNGSVAEIIPFQHLRVLNKKEVSKPLFIRNTAGQVVGIDETNLSTFEGLPALVPVSSGKSGDGGIRTFSGIFPINMEKTKNGSKSTNKEAAMSHSTYVRTFYSGRASGVAIHGTPTNKHKYLGVRRDSHGCLRTYPAYAKIINSHVLSADMYSEAIPQFARSENLPNLSVQAGTSGTMEGSKTLIIMFDGYTNPQTDI